MSITAHIVVCGADRAAAFYRAAFGAAEVGRIPVPGATPVILAQDVADAEATYAQPVAAGQVFG